MDETILELALVRYGHVNQMLMAAEEASELTTSIMHFLRGRTTREDVASEIADVMITASQLRILIGRTVVDRAIADKMARLEARLATSCGGDHGGA
jgi:NTP pyrophosphatase (non-canonical NTP hydrolase)